MTPLNEEMEIHMEKHLLFFYNWILSPTVLISVLCAGIFITFSLKFFYLYREKTIFRTFFRVNDRDGVSPLRALTVALAGTLGVGNIAGVAAALTTGGPGAIFWMWIGAIFSMLIKYAEVVLAILYRKKGKDGYYGGAMYYFSSRKAGMLFSVLCLAASFALGNIMQAQTVAETMKETFSIPPIVTGLLLALILYLTICKGFSRISSVTLLLVPLMSGIYIFLCLVVLAKHAVVLPSVFGLIVRSAFTPQAALGGIGAFSWIAALRAGISKGLITHEAGCGTAPMAHAGANARSPVEQGFWGIFEVFADTILLCSLTAFVLLISWRNYPNLSGMALVIACFSDPFGKASGIILSLLIFCFALATMIGWSYYGRVSIDFLSPKPAYKKLYALAYSFSAFWGALTGSTLMWLLADYSVGLMTLLHIPCLLSKTKEVRRETVRYFRTSHSQSVIAHGTSNIPCSPKRSAKTQRLHGKYSEQ